MLVVSPAKLYTIVVSVTLVVAGILGFFVNDVFTSDEAERGDLLGLFAVNGWHDTFHVVSGVIGLLCIPRASRAFALVFGNVYLVLAVWGFILGNDGSILSIIPINTADNLLHLVLGGLGVVTGLMTPSERELRTSTPPKQPSHA